MKKIIFLINLSLITTLYSLGQSNTLDISIIRQYVEKVENSLKDDNVNMYVSSDYDGNRWFYIKDSRIDGLRSDEGYISLEYSSIYIKMLYLAINHDLEKPISLADLPQLLLSKGIKGVQFVTKNNEFYFKWTEIMNKINSKSN